MGISIADNFNINMKKPIDGRMQYATLAAMAAVVDANINEGCLAYCEETDKYYKFLSTNTVDPDTGKWREFSSGGGSTIQVDTMPTASATELGNIYQYVGTTTNDYINGCFYECVTDGSTYSWENKSTLPPLSSGGMADIVNPLPTTYHGSFGFTPVGTVIAVMGNSAPLHYLACNGQVVNIADYPELASYFLQQFGSKNKFGGDGTTTFGIPDLRGEFLRGTGTNSHANQGDGANVGVHQDGTEFPRFQSWTDGTNVRLQQNLTSDLSTTTSEMPTNIDHSKDRKSYIQTGNVTKAAGVSSTGGLYTARPTNTSVLFCIATKNIYLNPSLDYSTDEKVVGTWIDGKPLYQCTTVITDLPNENMTQTQSAASNIDNVVDIKGVVVSKSGMVDPIPKIQDNSTTMNMAIDVLKFNGNIQLKARATTDIIQNWEKAYVTIQYTKTTD